MGGGCSPRKFWNFELPSSIWGYFSRPYRRLELEHFELQPCLCYEPARAQRKVTVVLTPNTLTLRSGEHTDFVILKIKIAILRSSISTPLSTFSAQFAIDITVHSAPIIWAQPLVARHVPQCGYATAPETNFRPIRCFSEAKRQSLT